MNKYLATAGVILLLLAIFFFFAVFVGGSVGSFAVTGSLPLASFAAFLFAIIFLPIGCGLAFVGFARRSPVFAASQGGSAGGGSGVAKAALAVAIIAILISAGTLAAIIAVSGQISSLGGRQVVTTTVTGTGTGTGLTTTSTTQQKSSGALGIDPADAPPATRLFRIDWCNTDPAGQDRFCPSQIVVNQGDTVIILFEHNDTDTHTFTILGSGTSGYDLQINGTFGMPGYTNINGTLFSNGMRNFLTNANYTGSCTNVGSSSFSQQTAGISNTLCVSGSSLLPASSGIAVVNPTPGMPLNASAPNGGLVELNDTNSVAFLEPGGNMSIANAVGGGVSCTAAACTNPETGAPSSAMTQGILAFQASSAGTFEYFCHYHVSNGMFGYITVLQNSFCSTNPSGCGISNSTSTSTTT